MLLLKTFLFMRRERMMENKLRMVQRGLIGFFGYFLGSFIWAAFAGGDNRSNSIAGILTAIILFVTFEIYLALKKPKERAFEKMLNQDERLAYLRLKATMVSSYFLKLVLVGFFLFYVLNGTRREALFPGMIFIMALLIEGIAYSFYKRRM